ncbi:SusC/RagA family TonB-linked outer membrane protein [Puteibacter caeruleilacunae]|nr:SusC/RagA family TonB-linked outer membrane protein [Puteibacter caeruleilacunae]
MKRFYYNILFLVTMLLAVNLQAQESQVIVGKVTSSEGNIPLEGISVGLENIAMEGEVRTNEQGAFKINVPHGNVTLVFEYPDYHTQHVFLNGRSNVEVKMIPTYLENPERRVRELLGQNRLDKVAANVTAIKGEKLRMVDETGFDAMTIGTMTGVYATTRSGQPGAAADMIIHGPSSFSGKGTPLVVVDGLIMRNQDYPLTMIEGTTLSDYADLNPQDIKSVSVLKNAAATAIYGAQGANGVILISTHDGAVGKTKLEVTTSAGIASHAGDDISLLNADQHRLFVYDQLYNSGWTADQLAGNYADFLFNNPESVQYERYNNDTDWQGEVYNDAAVVQNHYVRISGGDQRAKYALSMGYNQEEGVINNTDLRRFTARLNVDYKLSEKMNYGSYISLTNLKSDQFHQGSSVYNPVFLALGKTPTMAPFAQNAFGENTVEYDEVGELMQTNPTAYLKGKEMNAQRNQFNVISYLDYTMNNNWYFKMNVGVVYENQKEGYFIPAAGVAPVDGKFRIGGRSDGTYYALSNEWFASYTKQSGEHFLNVNAKANLHYSQMEMSFGEDVNASNDYQQTLDGAQIDMMDYGNYDVGNLSMMLSANYTYKDKYLLTLNTSTDASSRFGSESSVGFFPGLSAGWRISNEDFWNTSSWVDEWKLTASYGLSGNSRDLPHFQSRSFYVPGNYIYFGGVVRDKLADEEIKWESTAEFTFGTYLRALNNRFTLEANYYNRLTSDIIVPKSISPVSGLKYVQVNEAEVMNQGVELSAGYWVIDKNDLKWYVAVNGTINNNEIKKLPGNKDIIYEYNGVKTILREGESIGAFYGYETNENVLATNADATLVNEGYAAFQGGDVSFVDQDKNGTLNSNDEVVLGNGFADIYGGISTRLVFQNLEFSALCDFRTGNDVWNATRRFSESMSTLSNQSTAVLNRWSNPGDVTSMPRAVANDPAGNNRASDRWVEDGAFFRIRNVKLSYNFPNIFGGMKVYVSADNVKTFSKYLGYHPEVNATGRLVMPGVDMGNVPQPKTVMLGINLSL